MSETLYKAIKTEKGLIKGWFKGVPIEDKALQQLTNLSSLPFIHKHVAAMPDTHWGLGATIGSVIATKDAIIPAAVGVDIGCGMAAQRTSLSAKELPINLNVLRTLLEEAIPHGRTDNGGSNDKGSWKSGFNPDRASHDELHQLQTELKEMSVAHPTLTRGVANCLRQAGTLGGGNHFVEVCLDESDDVWIMLHSGSRGVGNMIGKYFIDLAKKEMKRWFISLPDADLAYFPQGSQYFSDYIKAVNWAQRYAALNRAIMMRAALRALSIFTDRPFANTLTAVNCHHNYVNKENHFDRNVWVTRKGAVSARLGELGIIPGSMGAKSFIVKGKGNPESFCSCSHGAGRVMSRSAAEKEVSLEQHVIDTAGIECRKDIGVLDETPKAYKNIDDVMAAQEDLVEIVHTLRQIVCVKG